MIDIGDRLAEIRETLTAFGDAQNRLRRQVRGWTPEAGFPAPEPRSVASRVEDDELVEMMETNWWSAGADRSEAAIHRLLGEVLRVRSEMRDSR